LKADEAEASIKAVVKTAPAAPGLFTVAWTNRHQPQAAGRVWQVVPPASEAVLIDLNGA
jgi:hypothetical protein